MVQRRSEMLYIVFRDTGDRDTAILGQIHMVVIDKLGDLLGRDAKESKHADLVGNVVPVALGAVLVDQEVLERCTHRLDAVRHLLELRKPLAVQPVSYTHLTLPTILLM